MPRTEVQLRKQAAEELGCVVRGDILPIELPPVHHASVAHVKDIDRDERGLGVDADKVDVATLRRSHALLLGDFLHRRR